MLKQTYSTAGNIYGYLSRFTHWEHIIHGHFLNFDDTHVAVLKASVRYRAVALALCLVILDVFVEVVRHVYAKESDALVLRIRGASGLDDTRMTCQYLSKIADLSGLDELREIQAFFLGGQT
jgi:hypothetical protein